LAVSITGDWGGFMILFRTITWKGSI